MANSENCRAFFGSDGYHVISIKHTEHCSSLKRLTESVERRPSNNFQSAILLVSLAKRRHFGSYPIPSRRFISGDVTPQSEALHNSHYAALIRVQGFRNLSNTRSAFR